MQIIDNGTHLSHRRFVFVPLFFFFLFLWARPRDQRLDHRYSAKQCLERLKKYLSIILSSMSLAWGTSSLVYILTGCGLLVWATTP